MEGQVSTLKEESEKNVTLQITREQLTDQLTEL